MKTDFIKAIEKDLLDRKKHNKTSVEKLAASFGILDRTEVKEYTELAIVHIARKIAAKVDSRESRFEKIVELYKNQVNLSHRTSQSIMLQQYSTPAPIAFLAGLYTLFGGGNLKDFQAFEPSAGNGLLTIAFNPFDVVVNEIDKLRRSNLEEQGFRKVLARNATEPFEGYAKHFDAVVTNPPFGTLDTVVQYDGFPIKTLDHLMALRALDTMKDNGRAAIIIGGHTQWDDKGRIQAGKNRIFFNYLYSHYFVDDMILIDGAKLYSRQGTSFDVRIILIAGRKSSPSGFAPLYNPDHDFVINDFNQLFHRVMEHKTSSTDMKKKRLLELEAQALALELSLLKMDEELGAPYLPASESKALETVVPDSMSFETQEALEHIKNAVGGDIDAFVQDRLDYRSESELFKALSAEQIDAVAMAIYNIEAREQGMIIGDQTGIGKGRVAAAMVRYGVVQGLKPVFITEKANLFSDLYRDLLAIGSGYLKPFIINGRESKTDIKDEDGNVVYQALAPTEQNRVFKERKVPAAFDFVMGTYSQFNSPEKKPEKPGFMLAITEGNLVIMDESHNSSGSSNTGEFMQQMLLHTKGVVFLSATFAKRPDNMPVYAMKTAISEANMSKDDLVSAILKGGVALQEILSSQLVAEGQMLRRERSFEGVEVNYITLEDKAEEHMAIADNITDIIRDIIGFQTRHIDDIVEVMDKIAAAENKEVQVREGTQKAGVDNQPYFSKVFQIINQMLFSIKAESVAERAILRLKEGKKPVIAFASTMGSFISDMENDSGLKVSEGDIINADFSTVLEKGLNGVMRYTEIKPDGSRHQKNFELSELEPEAQGNYLQIMDKIRTSSTGITISPIDVIIRKIREAGYTVAEVTGRAIELQINPKTNMGLVKARKRVNTNDAFRMFNNNEVDVLLINQSGSTGASAHAIITPKVPKEKVKQRVMIVLQAELDINTEVQKRGRINRTGQIYKPIYDYVNSAIPAEKRLMMMLQKKLKSLDANTTSNQKQSTKILDVPDFLNKYGDKIVKDYLADNPAINELLDDPLNLIETEKKREEVSEDAAHKVSGRAAVLSTKMQADFYNEISTRYNDYVEYLKQTGDYDLEVETMDLQAETISEQIIKAGKGGDSEFGDHSILKSIRANVLRKPFKRVELENILRESLGDKEAKDLQAEMLNGMRDFLNRNLEEELKESMMRHAELKKNISNEKKIKALLKAHGEVAYNNAMKERFNVIEQARIENERKIRTSYENRISYLSNIFKFFYIGRPLAYPVESFEGGGQQVAAIFLGYLIDRHKPNPFAPSAIKLRFAIANGNKYIAIPASYTKDINAIQGASYSIKDPGREPVMQYWEKTIQKNTVDRSNRYVITGNLLQAFSNYPGKLVSFSTLNGEVEKGILLPEYWIPDEEKQSVSVPISLALPIIRSMGVGSQINASSEISIFRHRDEFRLIVPASRQRGGDIYLNPEVLHLVENNIFDKISDTMAATVTEGNIAKMVDVLQQKFNASVSLSPFQFDMIRNNLPGRKQRQWKKLSLNGRKIHSLRLLELEAEAITLELELLNFAA